MSAGGRGLGCLILQHSVILCRGQSHTMHVFIRHEQDSNGPFLAHEARKPKMSHHQIIGSFSPQHWQRLLCFFLFFFVIVNTPAMTSSTGWPHSVPQLIAVIRSGDNQDTIFAAERVRQAQQEYNTPLPTREVCCFTDKRPSAAWKPNNRRLKLKKKPARLFLWHLAYAAGDRRWVESRTRPQVSSFLHIMP